MPSRRSMVASFATLPVVVLPLAGCMGPEEGPPRAEGAPTTSTDSTPDHELQLESRGPERARNDVEPSVREVEDDKEIELVSNGDEVRYVAGWRRADPDWTPGGDEPPEREPFYDTSLWERWSRIQCTTAGAQAAAEHVRSELAVGGVGGGLSSRVGDADTSSAVVMTHATLDRDGEVVSTPDVDYETLRATAPRSVEATYVLADRERTMDVPIYVRYNVEQYD